MGINDPRQGRAPRRSRPSPEGLIERGLSPLSRLRSGLGVHKEAEAVRQGEELGAGLEGGDGVGAAGEPGGRLVAAGELDEGGGEFGGIAALATVHALPGGDRGRGPLGVVLDRGVGIAGRLGGEQLGALRR